MEGPDELELLPTIQFIHALGLSRNLGLSRTYQILGDSPTKHRVAGSKDFNCLLNLRLSANSPASNSVLINFWPIRSHLGSHKARSRLGRGVRFLIFVATNHEESEKIN
jgi:hypothetical protein